jgi:hypothetical protein
MVAVVELIAQSQQCAKPAKSDSTAAIKEPVSERPFFTETSSKVVIVSGANNGGAIGKTAIGKPESFPVRSDHLARSESVLISVGGVAVTRRPEAPSRLVGLELGSANHLSDVMEEDRAEKYERLRWSQFYAVSSSEDLAHLLLDTSKMVLPAVRSLVCCQNGDPLLICSSFNDQKLFFKSHSADVSI